MAAYYNEIDPYAAQWLRNLIVAGQIAPGVVDERSIEDVYPDDLRGYTQCHFFAGVGVWSYSLRRAGWPDDRPVWTGSCPCQPFSAAGKGAGFDDERHLWPAWHHLIAQCRPSVVFGEQVASKDADAWIDLVQDDLEALDYAVGAQPFPSASVGAPHIRDRLYWLAHADQQLGRQGRAKHGRRHPRGDAQSRAGSGGGGMPIVLSDASSAGLEGRHAGAMGHERAAAERGGAAGRLALAKYGGCGVGQPERPRASAVVPSGAVGRMADADSAGRSTRGAATEASGYGRSAGPASSNDRQRPAGPTNGPWAAADWLFCRDGKWRPVEPGTFPLAHGAPSRVGRLRAYGNAINAYQAQIFIEASMKP